MISGQKADKSGMVLPIFDIILSLLIMALTWFLLVGPIVRANRERARRRFQEAYREHQLEAIVKFHPIFQDPHLARRLTWRDIERRFPVNRLYDQIR